MARNFPPKPVYPTGIDSDRTLFLVYNTTESILSVDNQPWSEEIEIIPVSADEPEIWPDNGFGTINGELFYYDRVAKNPMTGKVYLLQKCVRNLGGDHTSYNSTTGGSVLCPRDGTIVRGMVVAEHHNQLVDAIYQLEHFIGYNYDPNVETLDYRIRCLKEVPICADDFCMTVNSFQTTETTGSACVGIQLQYNIDIEGLYDTAIIDFGDGTTSTNLSGTHNYPPTVVVDPVVTVTSAKCQLIQTPTERLKTTIPEGQVTPPFTIPIPECPPFPDISVISCDIVPPELIIPPILFPCLSMTPIEFPSIMLLIDAIGAIPSVIDFGPVNIPSLIEFGPVDIPSLINFGPVEIPSLINFGDVNIPSLINFGDINIPSLINFGPIEIPSLINFGDINIPSLINFGDINIPSLINFGPIEIPSLINFGPIEIPSLINFGPIEIPTMIEFGPVTIPTMIEFGPVEIPTVITVIDTIPDIITVIDTIPVNIQVNDDIPDTIQVNDDIPDTIQVNDDIPDTIQVNDNIPTSISVTDNIPNTIQVNDNIPSTINVVFGTPPTISVTWGTPPTVTCSCTLTVTCPSSGSMRSNAGFQLGAEFGERNENVPIIEPADIGIPSEIQLVAPTLPRVLRLEHNLPEKIILDAPDIPRVITLKSEYKIPEIIKIVSDFNIPDTIKVMATDIPSTIEFIANLPESIKLEIPANFPKSIKIDASEIPDTIKVTGVPETIAIVHDIPQEIYLKKPDDLTVDMVYRGAPIDVNVKVDMNLPRLVGATDKDAQCVMIVPCPNK